MTLEKRCSKCGITQPAGNFSKEPANSTTGLNSQCKNCRKVYAREWMSGPKGRHIFLSRYGLTLDAYNALVDAQDGVCAICGKPEQAKRGCLCVDHDHNTGQVRGLLCTRCNTGLGMFLDNPSLLLEAVAYLERHWLAKAA
jgi:hypothetical protein